MSEVNRQPARVPLVDPSTGTITREWYRFFEQMFSRVGGTYSQTNNELAVDLHDDAGIEETKADLYRLRDEVGSIPPSQQTQDTSDPHGRIEALEAALLRLTQEVEAIKQGSML